LDGAGRRGGHRPALGRPRRSAADGLRRLPAARQPRRAAAAVQRAPWRDEPGRPATRAPVVRGRFPTPRAALHAAAQGQGRHHGLGADQRLARQYVDREAHRVRPLLHRALVARLRHQDPAANDLARLPPPERILTAVSDALRGVLPGERPWRARVVDALLVALAIGLACSITLSELTLLVLAAVLLTGARPQSEWLRAPLVAPVLAFAAWAMVAAATALDPAESLRSTKSLLILATFWVVQAALPDAPAARRFATTIFVAVSVVACLSIVQVAACVEGGYGDTPQIPVIAGYFKKCVRAHGFFSIYMTLAGVLLVVVTMTLPRLTGFRRPALAGFGWLAGVVALALAGVRRAWIGFGLRGPLTGVLGRRRWLLLLLAALPLAALGSPHMQERLRSMVDPTDPTARERLVMFRVGAQLVREHPVLGIGPGQVKRVYPTY